MAKTLWMRIAALTGLLLSWTPEAFSKQKKENDFPDYNRLEYAKPLPAPDEQVAPPPPGSFSMRVGEKKKTINEVPPDILGVPIRPRDNDNGSEPPISDLLDDYKITPASSAGVTASTPTLPAVPPQASTTPAAATPETKLQ